MASLTRVVTPRLRLEPHRDESWFEQAACRTQDRRLFFEGDRESTARRDRREQAAKAVCAVCPVRRECLSYALSIPERYGIWGGLNSRERAHVGHRKAPSRRTDRRGP